MRRIPPEFAPPPPAPMPASDAPAPSAQELPVASRAPLAADAPLWRRLFDPPDQARLACAIVLTAFFAGGASIFYRATGLYDVVTLASSGALRDLVYAAGRTWVLLPDIVLMATAMLAAVVLLGHAAPRALRWPLRALIALALLRAVFVYAIAVYLRDTENPVFWTSPLSTLLHGAAMTCLWCLVLAMLRADDPVPRPSHGESLGYRSAPVSDPHRAVSVPAGLAAAAFALFALEAALGAFRVDGVELTPRTLGYVVAYAALAVGLALLPGRPSLMPTVRALAGISALAFAADDLVYLVPLFLRSAETASTPSPRYAILIALALMGAVAFYVRAHLLARAVVESPQPQTP